MRLISNPHHLRSSFVRVSHQPPGPVFCCGSWMLRCARTVLLKAKLGPNGNQLLQYKAVLQGRWSTVRGDYEALLQRLCLVIKLTYNTQLGCVS